MKKLVLVLVLANLAFFGWQMFGRPEPEAATVPVEQSTAPRLVLISELPPGRRPEPRAPLVPDQLPAGVESVPTQAPTPAEEPSAEASTSPPAVCFHLAGFPSAAAAAKTKGLLEKGGAGVGPAASEQYARTRWWVLLPPSRNEAQATVMVDRLKQAGVKDYYLIPDGPNQNAISLGVFSSQEGATRRVADMAGLKMKVRVEKVDYPGRRFALDVRWPGAVAADWKAKVPAGIEIANANCPPTP